MRQSARTEKPRNRELILTGGDSNLAGTAVPSGAEILICRSASRCSFSRHSDSTYIMPRLALGWLSCPLGSGPKLKTIRRWCQLPINLHSTQNPPAIA